MKQFMKLALAMVFIAILFNPGYVRAESFAGSAGSNYTKISGYAYKAHSDNSSIVHWKTSDKPSHKIWFGVIRGTTLKGEGLFNYLTPSMFPTYMSVTSSCYLVAKREHIGNPSAYITGQWWP